MSHYESTTAFFAALVELGVSHVVVSPGLRSVPLSLAAHATPGLQLTVVHDERVGGFTALGMAIETGRPVATVCTSGSALANLMPAVVEAHMSRVPLLVLTGDRPAELHGWDSPQTIVQVNLYGSFASTIALPGDGHMDLEDVVAAAVAAYDRSMGTPAGPVHVNWPFREPLEPAGPVGGSETRLPLRPIEEDGDAHALDETTSAALAGSARGLIAVGQLDDRERRAVIRIAANCGWPIVADPLSGLRVPGRSPHVITTADHLLASEAWADEHVPDVILRVGSAPTSKSLRLWMERVRPASVVVVDPAGKRRDPSRTMTHLVTGTAHDVADAVIGTTPSSDASWLSGWSAAEAQASRVIDEISAGGFEEAAATRTTSAALDADTRWHVASSTPIRDVDWFVPEISARLTSNRGANGIDGTISTALGIALGGEAWTVVTLGDVALLHDVGGLFAAGRQDRPPTVVLYDNGGGGIFSLLPIASAADPAAFSDVLHTPTNLEPAKIATAAGFDYAMAGSASELASGLAAARQKPSGTLLHVPLTVAGTREQLIAIRAGIAEAL